MTATISESSRKFIEENNLQAINVEHFLNTGYAPYVYNTTLRIVESCKRHSTINHKDIFKALRGVAFETLGHMFYHQTIAEDETLYGPRPSRDTWNLLQARILAHYTTLQPINLVPDGMVVSNGVVKQLVEYKSTFQAGRNLGSQMENYIEAA